LAWSLAAILFALSAPASAPVALGAAKAEAGKKVKAAPAKHKKPVRPRHELAKEAGIYWDEVIAKRRVRIAKRRNGETIVLEDYVLTQPPLYIRPLPPRPLRERVIPRIPVLTDFLRGASTQQSSPTAEKSLSTDKRPRSRGACSRRSCSVGSISRSSSRSRCCISATMPQFQSRRSRRSPTSSGPACRTRWCSGGTATMPSASS
jgi:hypothetical protein